MNALDDASGSELEALLALIYRRYHYDFRHYVRSVVHRRLARACTALGAANFATLRERIEDPVIFTRVLGLLTIQVSDLFRDPCYFRALREQVVPHLATYPSIRIWVAGCGAGEEAYSLAIVLAEEGLLDRSLIYATDIDPKSLRIAASGAYAPDRVQGFTRNYFAAGGRASLSDHLSVADDRAVFVPSLRNHIVVADHCLATDAAFAEVQLVSCRNVLIYFERPLQDRALGLFYESLVRRSFLGLGSREGLSGCGYESRFVPFAEAQRIYRSR